jgi:hypothetical protein
VVERVPTGIGNLGYRQRSPNWLAVGLVAGGILLLAILYRLVAPSGADRNDPGLLARAPAATATTAPVTSEQRTFRADRLIKLTLGNAGGVQLTVNGHKVGLAGSSGNILHRTFKPGAPPTGQ